MVVWPMLNSYTLNNILGLYHRPVVMVSDHVCTENNSKCLALN